jgi:hypothetical protein
MFLNRGNKPEFAAGNTWRGGGGAGVGALTPRRLYKLWQKQGLYFRAFPHKDLFELWLTPDSPFYSRRIVNQIFITSNP